MTIERSLQPVVLKDLQQKFVFLSGPRQVGKTNLAKTITNKEHGVYLLYDDDDDRKIILDRDYLHHKFVCLDEFHKFPRWKAHLKGVYDKYHEELHLLLTGSARLDVYQKSGDSLLGRYYLHHLHPLTCGELSHRSIPQIPQSVFWRDDQPFDLKPLLKFGGFPEPFVKQSLSEHKRWSRMRTQLLLREDFRELSHVHLLALVEKLMLLLPQRIGSLFSYRSLSEDLKVSVPTVQNWLSIFEKLFLVFKILPYSKNVTRSLVRQPKYFLYDWSQLLDDGAAFENFVASHLFKAAQVWSDLGYGDIDVNFIRDRDRREVDFLLTKDSKPWFLVECKLSDVQISDALSFFSARLQVPGIQLVLKEGIYKQQGNILVTSASTWLPHLL